MLSIEADKSSEMNRSYAREVEFLALSDFQKDSKEIAGKILAGGGGERRGSSTSQQEIAVISLFASLESVSE